MDPPQLETVAGRYQLLELIGQGGQALVFRARDLQAGEPVAVKMLTKDATSDPSWIERMAREQQAMVELAGTGAVGFKDLCTSASGALCLVMELLEGRDLEALLQAHEDAGERLALPEVLRLMGPIVDTLSKAHAVGIVHRDLKPGNIFIPKDAGATTRLLDFGLARSKSSRQVTAAGTVLGSPSYIAPEMWLSRAASVDPRVDVYSLGVILFRMLGGQLPFQGNNLQQKFIAITTADRPSLHALRPELPRNVDIWVERALAIEPGDRFPSVRASFGELLWAVGLAPHPSRQRRARPPGNAEVRRIRAWLDAPFGALPSTFGAALRAAQGAFGKLKRLAFTSDERRGSSEPPANTKPPPEPSKLDSATFALDVSGTRPSVAAEPLLRAENTNAVGRPDSTAPTLYDESSDRETLGNPEPSPAPGKKGKKRHADKPESVRPKAEASPANSAPRKKSRKTRAKKGKPRKKRPERGDAQ